MEFKISATTDVGARRPVNQDSLMVRRLSTRTGNMVFAVLCDGMGGLQHGEFASASLIRAFSEWMYGSLPILSQKPLEDCLIRSQWESVIEKQNEKILAYGREKGCRIGSTVTALLLTEDRFYLLNVGDSRAYEIKDETRQLTVDHTLVEEEVQRGNLTREQAQSSPVQNVLTRCVGAMETVVPDLFFGTVRRGAVYMLCSDGFRHHVTGEEIRNGLMSGLLEGSVSIKRREESLVELNKQRGETDNISVITIYAG